MTYDYTIEETYDIRDKRLVLLGYSTYDDFLLSEHWKDIRLKAMTRANYRKCEYCGTTENIHLHHSSYKYLGCINELRNVYAFCEKHHRLIHSLSTTSGVSVRIVTNYLRNPDNPITRKQALRVNPNSINIFDAQLRML